MTSTGSKSYTPEACYVAHCLAYPETLDLHPVDSDRFASPKHTQALHALRSLHAQNRVGILELTEAVGRDYVLRMPAVTDYAEGASGLVARINDGHLRRTIAETLSKLQTEMADPTIKTKDHLSACVGALLDVQIQDEQIATFREVLAAGFERVDRVYESKGILGLSTGWPKLDDIIGGWEPDKLYFVAARPGAGKTSFGLQTVVHAAHSGANVYVSSQEMGRVQVAMRLLSQEGRVSAEKMRVAHLDDPEWAKLQGAAGRLMNLPGWIDTRTCVSLDALRSSVLRAHAKSPVGLVMVDYVQMMRAKGESKVYELEAIAYGLKSLAKELQAPVIALSQLNREAEEEQPGKGARKAPGLDKMRGSGGLEQAADVVVILWRPQPKEQPSSVEVRVAKHRDGRTGKFLAKFLGEFTRFEEESQLWQPR